MSRVLKVLCTPAEQDSLAGSYRVIERYDAFIVIEAPDSEVAALSSRFPIEDISDQYVIEVGGEEIDTSTPRVGAKGREHAHPAYKGIKRLTEGAHHYLVQFIGPIKEAWLKQVEKAGGELRTLFSGFTYVVRAKESGRAAIAELPCVRWMGHFRHDHRIDESLRERESGDPTPALPRTRVLPDSYTVEFFDARDMKAGLTEIRKLGFKVTSQDADAAVAIVLDPGTAGASKRLRDLSAVHGVWRIRQLTLKRPSNDVAAGIMGTQASLGAPGLGLSGAGEIIAVADTGIDTGVASTIHRDFGGRTQAIVSFPMAPGYGSYVTNAGADDGPADLDSGHGTHVAGSVLGDGASSAGLPGAGAPIRGLAHRARVVFQAIEQEMKWRDPANLQRYGRFLLTGIPTDLKTLFGDAHGRGARIHTNSWGGGAAGAYDEQCEQLDEFVWEHKDFCILFANGNDGTDSDGDGRINPTSVTSPATSKNCISVGASENVRPNFDANTYGGWWPRDYPAPPIRNDAMANNAEQVAAFSSRGPTSDGRIKPDVVAPGTYILSTRSTMIAANNMGWAAFPPSRLYFHMGGTSMATPLTAGAVGLIREYLRTRQSMTTPSAALLKATLIAGARRLAGSDPAVIVDSDQGFGRVNLDAILAPPAPAAARFIDRSAGLSTGDVHAETVQVASRQEALRVVMAYSDFPGPNLINNLNLVLIAPDGTRFVGNASTAGGLALDAKNNVEVVQVGNPTPGAWTVQVVASNVARGPQDFALVMLGHFGEPTPAEGSVEVETAPNLAIPDNTPQGVSSTLRVDRAGSVSGLRISVDVRHTYIGDLRVMLTAPDNQRITLHDRSGGSADDIRKTYDPATTSDLTRLIGVGAQGDWTLTVVDIAAADVGTLKSWKLELTLAESDPFRGASEPGVQIPDNNPAGVSDGVDITGVGNVRDVRVSVDITHTYIGDLRVSLRSPSGREVVLHNRTGRGADNILETYDVSKVAALAGFAGEPAAGRWVLSVADLAGRDVGKLNRWELRITPA